MMFWWGRAAVPARRRSRRAFVVAAPAALSQYAFNGAGAPTTNKWGLAIFALTYLVFTLSPVHQLADSQYSMLLSQSLLQHRTFTLDHYPLPRLEPKQQIGWISNGYLYQLELINGHIYYYFPPGSSILSVPYVAVMNALGIAAVNPDGSYNRQGEIAIQAGLAALLMAALATIFFYTARLVLPLGWSLLLSLGAAFGTQMWSTASRSLWSDTWAIFLLGCVVWMLVAHECGQYHIRPVLLASLLAWTYFVRPTNILAIAAITIYVFVYRRPLFARYAVTGSAWLLGFFAYSWYHFGQLLPHYFQGNLTFRCFWTALAGNLISPSRGLFVYVPVLGFIAYWLIRYARESASPRLVIMSVGIILVHLIVIAGFFPWWGGHCYGPRYTTGLLPWFVLLGIQAIRARLTWEIKQGSLSRSRDWRSELIVGAALLGCSMVINARGAIDHRTTMWNFRPMNINDHPERVWDWSDPQFLAR
ncbi:MAG: hypothetical protein M3347_13955 [Armatimonadota bacterium]|nr:hypothetical protein [Armatimonadota bacterium]